jgi:hypothetical protein
MEDNQVTQSPTDPNVYIVHQHDYSEKLNCIEVIKKQNSLNHSLACKIFLTYQKYIFLQFE